MAEEKKVEAGFFHDDKGNKSSKRLMAFVCLIVGILLAVAWVVIIIVVPPLERITIPSFGEVILIFVGSALALQGISLGQEIIQKKKAKEDTADVGKKAPQI